MPVLLVHLDVIHLDAAVRTAADVTGEWSHLEVNGLDMTLELRFGSERLRTAAAVKRTLETRLG